MSPFKLQSDDSPENKHTEDPLITSRTIVLTIVIVGLAVAFWKIFGPLSG